MAGTSNQNDSSSCWDVFLSFRGDDTRKNFTGHLYAALDQAEIRTFKDDAELETGEEISSELLKAIRNSKMSIVVFSKNYASSKWCLNELMEIMECKKNGQTVLPIFYDVEPSNVRHQTGSFAEAFERHKKHSMANIDKVKKWQAALTEAAGLSGYDLKHDANGHEADLIQKTVKYVLLKVCPKDLNLDEHLVGIDSHVKNIYPKLSIGSNDVRFIGIYGMAGIGKTTIAKALYNKIFKEFEGSCFLENVREALAKPHGLLYLLEQLIFQLLKIKNFKVASVETGISLAKQTLGKKRVLIVLDDLDQLSQVKLLAGHWNWFGSGSRIIITTQDACLLDKLGVDLRYEVKELNACQSFELFTWHAFRNTIPTNDFKGLSKVIVSYIGGLPLALEVLGSNLFQKTMVEWKSVFKKLQQIPNNQIQKILRISYQTLEDDTVQDIFLDIAFFFIGMNQDDAINILDDSGFFPEIGISILRGRSLLKIDEENNLRMHNLIRDMGREIVRAESLRKPRKRSRLWSHEDAYDVLNNLKGSETVEGIRLVMPMPKQVHLCTRAFEKMRKLRLLQISNVYLTGSFENLFEELRWFCWHYSPLEYLPSSFHPPKLVFLDIQYSNVNTLWQGTKHLQNLKILDASYSQFLTTTPDFEGVERLEKLLLQNCSSLLEIHPSIGRLDKLVHLNLKGCSNLKRLPEQLGNMKCLQKLDGSCTAIEQLPDSIGRLGRLVKLNLERCKNLRNLSSSICSLTSLESLNLCCCTNLERLPDKLGNMQALKFIDATATAIEQLPDSVGHLRSLETLYLVHCRSLQLLSDLPPNLYTLPLCSNLQSIHNRPPNLGCLDLTGGSRYQSLQNFPPNLGSLDLTGCSRLQSLPNFPPNLKDLSLSDCRGLQSLPELPPNLNSLHASFCTSLQILPNLHHNLEYLNLARCSGLQSLPELPHHLNRLDARYCTSLQKLPNLPASLKILILAGCSGLQSLPELPPNLIYLMTTDCRSLQAIPDLPPNLDYLVASGCTSLEKLPNFSKAKDLHALILTNCSNLTFTFKELFLEDFSGLRGTHFHLPRREIPDWFSHQSTGSSISFQMPQDVKDNLLWMVFWVVYKDRRDGDRIDLGQLCVTIINKIDGTEFKCLTSVYTKGVNSWVRYIANPFSMRSGDRIVVSFTNPDGGYNLEMYGVHLLYKSDSRVFDCKKDHAIDISAETNCRSKRLKF